MGGKKIVELGEPTENEDAVTKRYTDLFYQSDRNVSKDGDTTVFGQCILWVMHFVIV